MVVAAKVIFETKRLIDRSRTHSLARLRTAFVKPNTQDKDEGDGPHAEPGINQLLIR